MRHQVSGKEFVFTLTTDVRRWYSGELQVDERVLTDATMPQGKYNLFLYLPDKYPSIAARPEYAIRLANAGVWETATGYNQLSATITIDQ
jgi:hypothetical protein